jgi:acyl-CoA hydrolase
MGRPFQQVSLTDAVGRLRAGMKVLVAPGAGDPSALIAEILRQADRLAPLTLMGGLRLDDYAFAAPAYAGKIRFATWHMSPRLAEAEARGDVDFVPARYFDTVSLFSAGGAWAPDAVLVHTAPPDRGGYLSLGVSVSYLLPAARRAPLVVAQVNPRMPRSHGDGLIHVDQIDAMVEVDDPIHEVPPREVTEQERAIGRHCAELVDDGATLQIGIGAIPQATLAALGDHHRLGVHTEMISDGVLDLVEKGVVTGEAKRVHAGKIVAGFALGSRRLYDFLDDNPLVAMLDMAYINEPANIRRNPKVTAINSAIEVDITGQVCADSIGDRQYSGVGGQMDFIRGASLSPGGKPVIALPSRTSKGAPRIVPMLQPGAGVVTTRAHVHWVVTEHGIADLYGRNLRQRARALIAVADPAHRDELERAARERFGTLP